MATFPTGPPEKCFLSSIRDPKTRFGPYAPQKARRAGAGEWTGALFCAGRGRGCAEPVRTHVAGDGARPPRTCGKSSGRWDRCFANVGTPRAPPPKKLDADPDMGRWIARLALTLFDPHQPFANLPVCLSALVADRGCGQAV